MTSGQASAAESPEVEALIQRGIRLRREGQDDAALAIFLEAEAEAPNSVRVLLHVVTAAQAASKWLMADEYLKKADSHARDPYYARYRTEIEDVRAVIAQRVGHFRAVGGPSGADVLQNGKAAGTLPMEKPKTVEAGTFVMEVSKSGYYALRRPVTIPGGVLTRETVSLTERTEADIEARGVDGTGRPVEPPSFWASSGMTWTLAGIGLAAGATSGAAFYLRERSAREWNDDARCLSEANQTQTRANVCANVRSDIDTAENVALIGGVVGVAFVGAALTHWLATGTSSSSEMDVASGEQESTGSVQCGAGLLNVVCSGTF
jgi:hypothetical protein